MAHLDYASCTPREVITLAYVRHADAFIATMRKLAKQHEDAAEGFLGTYSQTSARRLARHCEQVADLLSRHKARHMIDAVNLIMEDMPLWIPALNVACDLLHVPRHWRSEISTRHPLGSPEGEE